MFKIIAGVLAGAAFLLGASTIFGSWYTIDQGERGVLLRNGALIGVAEPGLGFKLPFFDSVRDISVQTHAQLYENMDTYSADQQPAQIRLSVNYRIPVDKVAEVYSQYGSVENLVSRLIDRKVSEHTKNVFGQYNAATAIRERSRLNAEVSKAISQSVIGPVVIESVQIENIDFSDAYETSVENRMLAEVEVQKLKQNAEREKVQAEIAVTQAKGRAAAVIAEAEASAQATKLKGEAEAYAIDVRGKALAENKEVVALVTAEKWNGILPTSMVPSGAVPFLNVNGR